MSQQDAFDRILASLHEAMLDDSRWPVTSALIDDACRTMGNALLIGQGPADDIQVHLAGHYYRGERREDLEREYLESYHPRDERVPRLRQLPDSRVVHVTELYTAQELKTSPTYNEFLPRSSGQNSLNVRLGVSSGSHLTWVSRDPIAPGGWGSAEIELIERLLPHIRQFVRVRQVMAGAEALASSVAILLDNTQVGVIQLDRRGRIIEANDRARNLLRQGHGLSDHSGFLGAWLPDDNCRLERLLADALPPFGGQAMGGSVTVTHTPGRPRLVLHVTPVRAPQFDFGVRRVAALVLVVDPSTQPTIDAGLVAEALGLTPAESEVAAWLGEGRTVGAIAADAGRQENTVYRHLKQIYRKLGISRQADLVRLARGLAGFSRPRR